MLEADGQPRILLVAHGEPAPVTVDPLEDWVRLPVDGEDLNARVETLTRRNDAGPTLDHDDGILRHRGSWVPLPPIEVLLVQRLMAAMGKVVSRQELLVAGWPDEEPRQNVLDVHIMRLRRSIEGVELSIRTVRKRGYVLEALDLEAQIRPQ